ncbi:hypothetical protein FHS09_001954 [Microbulbifer rhizosphaerae]|uniref:Uncharacterized protein n=1 Tax=Microbulbifer rhizosphaerae TaxID=1562603 RepID=A0A7W4ZAA2_9GAMM|nr:hypothetical protein [Microbulbifer rhizosphaerae]
MLAWLNAWRASDSIGNRSESPAYCIPLFLTPVSHCYHWIFERYFGE